MLPLPGKAKSRLGLVRSESTLYFVQQKAHQVKQTAKVGARVLHE
jgi:hypothetical protein